MAATPDIKLLEKCRVAPPAGTVAELSLPLAFYDLQWLVLPPTQRLHFYRFPHPTLHFTETLIPAIKKSLSFTLKRFFPLAGNLICPVDSGMPGLRYKTGDSIPLTFAESSGDFDYLVSDHPRDSSRFYPLLPQLTESYIAAGVQVTKLFAIQITLFPNSGISIGRTSLHVLGDANLLSNFINSWASVHKFNGDLNLLPPAAPPSSSFIPSYDRSVVRDPYQLAEKIFNSMKELKFDDSVAIPNMTVVSNEVRATFVMCSADIAKLKSFVMSKRPHFIHSSTYTLVCAFIWTCLSRSSDAVGEKVEEDKREFFCAYIDCRRRLNPPIPQNYIGNCVVPCIAGSTHEELVGNEGLWSAAEAIGDAIRKRVEDGEGIVRGDWMSEVQSTVGLPGMLVVTGTPHYQAYDGADFGWGNPEKFEFVSRDASAVLMGLVASRRSQGGIEIGISLPKKKMEAFTKSFTDSLKTLHALTALVKCTE